MQHVILSIGEKTNGTYPVSLFRETHAPDWRMTPVATTTMAEPFPDPQGNWPDDDAARAVVRGTRENEQRALGEYLYGLIARNDVRTQWEAARAAGAATVLDIAPKNLRLLPWELLADHHEFLAVSDAHPVYRSFAAPNANGDCDELPLRVLIVVGADDGDPKVQWETEVAELRRLFRKRPARFDAEELIRPRRERISAIYRQFRPHVFHFIGHGTIVGGEAVLRIRNRATNRYDDWTPTQIKTDLQGWSAPMAFINACRSGESKDAASAYDIAAAFADLGTRCTITMQNEVDPGSAISFAKPLYERIADVTPLPVALAGRRKIVYQNGGDWAVPVLQLACAPADALPTRPAVAPETSDTVVDTFADLERFVDRGDERRGVCSDTLNPPAAGDPPTLFVIHGETGLGKTWFLQWCTRYFALRNADVRYVNLDDGRPKTFLQLLRIIRNGDGSDSPVLGRLDDPAMANFDDKLRQAGAAVEPTEDFIPTVAEAFRQGLREIAQHRKLLLCFDHVEWRVDSANPSIAASDLHLAKKELFLPIARNQVPNVRALLAITARNLDPQELRWLESNGRVVLLPEWTGDDYRLLARASLDDLFPNEDVANQFLQFTAMQLPPNGRWNPSFLSRIRKLMKDYLALS